MIVYISMIKKHSAGCYVLRRKPGKGNKYEILAIYKKFPDAAGWMYPKGGLESGESIEMAAVREVGEETGVSQVVLARHIGFTSYKFLLEGKKAEKRVDWFLGFAPYVADQVLAVGHTESEKKTQTKTEWIPFATALKKSLQADDIELLKKVQVIIA
jgi:8-oxo-dGTP pyrophosphatase MutT (NUDIX family)